MNSPSCGLPEIVLVLLSDQPAKKNRLNKITEVQIRTLKRRYESAVKENLDRLFDSIYHEAVYLVHPNP